MPLILIIIAENNERANEVLADKIQIVTALKTAQSSFRGRRFLRKVFSDNLQYLG